MHCLNLGMNIARVDSHVPGPEAAPLASNGT